MFIFKEVCVFAQNSFWVISFPVIPLRETTATVLNQGKIVFLYRQRKMPLEQLIKGGRYLEVS